jgi:hypothetical protein
MNELTRPFVRAWTWMEQVGGFPGQVFFCVAVIMLVIGFLTWFGNKK